MSPLSYYVDKDGTLDPIDELLAGITPEHGIPEDFAAAVRESHYGGVEALTAAHKAELESVATAHAAAMDTLAAAHAAEIERVRAEKFENVLDPDSEIDHVGSGAIDESLTIETYWEKAD